MRMTRLYGDPFWNAPDAVDVPARQASRRSARRREIQSYRASQLPVIELRGVELHAITERQTIDHIIAELNDSRGGVVVTPNLDYVRRCNRDLQFHAMVSEADLAVADGMPLIWASRLQGTPLPERVAGSNLISSLNAAAAQHGKRVFLLGGSLGAAEGAANVLRMRHPEIQIVGIHFPPFGFDKNPKMWDEMESALLEAKPDLIFVALGAPKQEKTICKLQPLFPQSWFIGVGNSFSFLAGQVQRAPRWMQKTGLEWVHRLAQEPAKLWKRYLISGVPFALATLYTSAQKGIPNRFHQWRFGIEPASTDAAPVNGRASEHVSANGRSAGVNGHGSAFGAAQPHSNGTGASAVAASVAAAPRPVAANHSSEQIFGRLRALILLGGSVRPSPLSAASGRSVLDLPLDENGSILNFWLAQAAEVARHAGLDRLPVRVLVNHASREPTTAGEKYFGSFRVEKDLSEYRGTGGVLRDVASDYADDDYVLVANACQILFEPLSAIAAALAKQGGDVNLIAHDDGTPSGVQLLSCKTVRQISHNGYHDMKEQALPKIATDFDVRVMRRKRPSGLPIRTLEDYIQGLRLYHRRKNGKQIISDPLAEDWSPSFSLIERGAQVHPDARIHDSVVLAGAIVDPGAVLVRCLVCGEASVRGDRTAVDQFITAAPRSHIPPMPVAASL